MVVHLLFGVKMGEGGGRGGRSEGIQSDSSNKVPRDG